MFLKRADTEQQRRDSVSRACYGSFPLDGASVHFIQASRNLFFSFTGVLCWKLSVIDWATLRSTIVCIYRHLTATPSFGGQTGGAGGTPRLSYLAFQTMEMPLDGDNMKDS